jgi:hypothetical protein
MPELPRRDATHQVDREGVAAATHAVVNRLKWIFREQHPDDYGIDAHIEVVSTENLVTGQLIGLQAKSGPSAFTRTTASGWTFYEKHRRHLNYWLGHTLPVILVLCDIEKEQCYWQVIDETTVKRTAQGFKVEVPSSQVLDGSAREPLEDLARKLGQRALEVYNLSLELLSEDPVRDLGRAAEQDRVGAARLAQVLADGRAEPEIAADQLLAAAPAWMRTSLSSGHLWAAVGGYANAHGHPGVAARAFTRAAEAGGRRAALRRAYAGLALLLADDIDQAREQLSRAQTDAQAAGDADVAVAVMLADTGLAIADVAPGEAQIVPVPASVHAATQQQLDDTPFLLNFLAENRQRAGEYDDAIALIKRAVARSDGREPGFRVRLAEMLRRRLQAHGGFGGPDSKAAREHARAALEDFRRWSGPSETALSELLDMEILDGDLPQAVSLALPMAVGGTAHDREAAVADIAMQGALAALMTEDHQALAWFRQTLAHDPRLLQLDAQQLELSNPNQEDRRRAWLRALEAADHTRHQVVCISRLAELGIWPIEKAEQLRASGVMPEWTYRIVAAKAQAADGDIDEAVIALRQLASDYATAGLELVRLLIQHAKLEAARTEWDRQYRRWHDVLLVEMLVDSPLGADPSTTTDLLLQLLSDLRLPVGTRMNLRRRIVARAASRGEWEHVVQQCRAGLADQRDNDLAWHLAAAFYQLHNTPQARATLTAYEARPENEQQARLWGQLRIGTDLTADEARLTADLAERYEDAPALAGGLTVLLHRELARHERAGLAAWPTDLIDRVHALIALAQSTGYGPQAMSTAELIEALRQDDRQELQNLQQHVESGRTALAVLATAARRPYGQVLLQQGGGVLVAADREPGLNQAGQNAARAALDAGSAVADLSALYALRLLDEDGRTLLARLPDLAISTSTADDAITTRNAIWGFTGASYIATLYDGALQRQTFTPERTNELRTQAAALEELVAQLRHIPIPVTTGPAHDSLSAAALAGSVLFADDVALRQTARQRGIRTFGTADLIAVLDLPNQQNLYRRLATGLLVDLPLTADDIVYLEDAAGWDNGPGMVTISRAPWWTHQPSSELAWRHIAATAAQVSAQAFIRVTQAALKGALAAAPPGRRMQRYQQLVVAALDAAQQHVQSVPRDYLVRLQDHADPSVVPQPKFIYRALLTTLQNQHVTDPSQAVARLLPDTHADPTTWL